MIRHLFLVLILINSGSIGIHAQTDKPEAAPFEDGDRVCFVGNSITQTGWYHLIVSLFYQTRYPDKSIRFFNCGVAGDNASLINRRFEKDVLSRNPTYLTCMTGMNDAWGTYYVIGDSLYTQQKNQMLLDKFKIEFGNIVRRINENAPLQAALISPSIFDQTAELSQVNYPGKNDLLRDMGGHMSLVSENHNYGFIDFNTPMLEINAKKQQEDPAYSICGTDRVHPGWTGHTVMAYYFLKSQLGESIVAEFEVNAQTLDVPFSDNCTISNLDKSDSVLSFVYEPNSLPFPMINKSYEGTFKNGLELVPFEEDFNSEIIKVTGLSGVYSVMIDGNPIDTVSGSELGAGINIGFNSHSPQQERARQIFDLMDEAYKMEELYRGAAWIAFRLLPGKGVSPDSPVAFQDTVINDWTGSDSINQMWADCYRVIYQDSVKRDSVWNAFDAYYIAVDTMNDPGSYTIRLKDLDAIHPTGIEVSPSTYILSINEKHTLSTIFSPASTTYKNVYWSSDNESVAIVDKEGIVTGMGEGTVTITATTADGGLRAGCSVSVQEPVSNHPIQNRSEGLLVYPNPCQDYFTLRLPKTEVYDKVCISLVNSFGNDRLFEVNT